jgi:hypothetical protein
VKELNSVVPFCTKFEAMRAMGLESPVMSGRGFVRKNTPAGKTMSKAVARHGSGPRLAENVSMLAHSRRIADKTNRRSAALTANRKRGMAKPRYTQM